MPGQVTGTGIYAGVAENKAIADSVILLTFERLAAPSRPRR